MAISNAERQKRWRDKNRALFNRRRREARRKKLDRERPTSRHLDCVGTKGCKTVNEVIEPAVSKQETLARLKEAIARPAKETVVNIKPLRYVDDYGRPITEQQWERLERVKAEAKRKGYEIDDYSQ